MNQIVIASAVILANVLGYAEALLGRKGFWWRMLWTLPVAIIALLAAGLAAHGQWYEYQPAGATCGPNILADVLSHCDAYGKRTAKSDDKVTFTHEGTHMVNSQIRNAIGHNHNAFYVGGGRAYVLAEPKVTLREVATYVTRFRNSTYELYFVQQAHDWNDHPLYIFDEWSAYANGSRAAKELHVDNHGEWDRANWFCYYASCLVEAVKERDPHYPQLGELLEFVDWQTRRVATLTKREL